jgi:hypothetical protein
MRKPLRQLFHGLEEAREQQWRQQAQGQQRWEERQVACYVAGSAYGSKGDDPRLLRLVFRWVGLLVYLFAGLPLTS